MKRSKNINLNSMRKAFLVKPLVVAITTAGLYGCGDPVETQIFASVEQCIESTGNKDQCTTAHREAVAEARRTAPKYASASDCQGEFGDQCVVYERDGNDWFMPAMAGFMLGRALDGDRHRYYHQPVFTSSVAGSGFYNRWTTADGRTYGSTSRSRATLDARAFRDKPVVSRTISRGGFGSRAAAKASWSGGSRGWGG